jgi:hypothetical protein
MAAAGILGALENTSGSEPMNEEKDQKPQGSEQDFSGFSRSRSQPPPENKAGTFLRGCGIATGIVALIFFFIVGACFLGLS